MATIVPFPFTHRRQIELCAEGKPTVSAERLLKQLERNLELEKAKHIVRRANKLSFGGGILRPVPSWNRLVAISTGRIKVVPRRGKLLVAYNLKFTQMFVFVTSGVFLFLGPFVWLQPDLSLVGKVAVLGFAWLCLFGGNFLITAFSFPSFIRKSWLALNADAQRRKEAT